MDRIITGKKEARRTECAMGAIMIKCPTTGQSIATGIETDPNSFKQIPDVLSRSRCPICGLEHHWWKREAWIVESREKTAVPTNGVGGVDA
jgi:hypothetical protein